VRRNAASRKPLAPAWSLRSQEKRRATGEGDAPPMGVSFHQAGRRFEGRESATINLGEI
jgi:hypothetical protein